MSGYIILTYNNIKNIRINNIRILKIHKIIKKGRNIK